MAQAEEHLPYKLKALSLNLVPPNNKKIKTSVYKKEQ
jgi:hypothetical protein